jgi:hypothetical protein
MVKLAFDAADQFLDVLCGHRSLGASDLDAVDNLAAVERFPPPISFYDHQPQGGDPLIGSETPLAVFAFSATTNAALGAASIDDPRIGGSAERTFHGLTP